MISILDPRRESTSPGSPDMYLGLMLVRMICVPGIISLACRLASICRRVAMAAVSSSRSSISVAVKMKCRAFLVSIAFLLLVGDIAILPHPRQDVKAKHRPYSSGNAGGLRLVSRDLPSSEPYQ